MKSCFAEEDRSAAAEPAGIARRVIRDLPFYDADYPRSGDLDYLAEHCRLDLDLPVGQEGFPTVIHLFGGGLIRGVKNVPVEYRLHPFGVAAVNYRLSNERGRCPDYLFDAAAATAWVLRHIARYGGDPARVYVGGHSAGAYLAVMLALDPAYLEGFGASPGQLSGVFPSSGQMTTHDQILAERGDSGPVIDEFAPLAHVRADAPPLIFIVGDDALEVPGRVGENRMIHSLLRQAGHPDCRCYQLEGMRHRSMFRASSIICAERILADLAT